MVYMAFVVDDLAVDRRSVDWCLFLRWHSTDRSWRWRARVLTDDDFFAVAVAPASLALVAANDDLFIVIAAGSAHSRALTFVRNWPRESVIITLAGRYSRSSIALLPIPLNDDFLSIVVSWRGWSPLV